MDRKPTFWGTDEISCMNVEMLLRLHHIYLFFDNTNKCQLQIQPTQRLVKHLKPFFVWCRSMLWDAKVMMIKQTQSRESLRSSVTMVFFYHWLEQRIHQSMYCVISNKAILTYHNQAEACQTFPTQTRSPLFCYCVIILEMPASVLCVHLLIL